MSLHRASAIQAFQRQCLFQVARKIFLSLLCSSDTVLLSCEAMSSSICIEHQLCFTMAPLGKLGAPTHPLHAGINNCAKSGRCAKNLGQVKNAQSYLCVTLDSQNLDTVAKVIRGNYVVQYGGDKAGATNAMPNVAALIDGKFQGEPCLTNSCACIGAKLEQTAAASCHTTC